MPGNRILIVDDELNNRRTLAAILAPLGADLVQAADGRSGLQAAYDTKPDIILLDVMMPDLDGYEVCRRVRNDSDLAEVPIIMITALDDRDSRLAGIEAGADDFIAKPVDRVELRTRVQTLLRLNRYRRLMGERARLSWMADHSNDGYVLVDAAGQILYANPRANLWLERGGGDAPGGDFAALVAEHYQTILPQDGQSLLVRPETETQRKLWLEWTEFEAPSESAGSRFIHLRNVTDQIELQYGTWSFNTLVTHKLRTPLAGLGSSLELLIEMAHESGIDDIAAMGELAQKSLASLKVAVKAVLDFVNAPSLANDGPPFALARLEELVAALALEMGVTATVAIAPELLALRLKLTDSAVQVILSELLANARKFHPAQRPNVLVSIGATDDGLAQMAVTDDGQSLPPEELTRIWRPYYQGEKLITGQVEGLGLGLAMINALVLSSGGSVSASNREDAAGLSIKLSIPLQAELLPTTPTSGV